ncbi:MFS transporter [Lentzea sp. NBRC 102530]|uniref:MFS transporter n=1 Tax=Lentzea sp. NBRC 102530 TaxID=3032201 RepID=UPI0024A03D2E|nr:MFS transporter [Lentzea sp. NBRC 102530]GLY50503.1 MFS transporter [Lentzea sp. NBRC 102530]
MSDCVQPRLRSPSSLREAWIALAGLSAVFLFEMLDNSILNVALPTIGRDLHASTTALQWVSNSYAVVFGGLMLVFGAVADRYGRRRVMLAGLALLGLASLATLFVTSTAGLIAVRSVMGVAAAMTTPGSIALAFRLFRTDDLRVRAMTLISTVGLVGLAIGPPLGGFLLAVAPWQALLLINVPIAALAFLGIGRGIAPDDDLHRDPADYLGGVLGTATVVLALVVPTFFAEGHPWLGSGAAALTVLTAVLFVVRQRTFHHPLLDLKLVGHPLVSSGLAYKAATGLAAAGLTYLVTLQLQLDWGWSPALAAAGVLPQVAVLIAAGPVVNRFVRRAGLDRAVWLGALAVVAGLAVYATLGRLNYLPVALALVLVAIGIRVVGAVAGVNVLKGLPENRTSIGAALADTASQVTSAAGVAVSGTVLAVLFAGGIAQPGWTARQTGQFETAVTIGGLTLTGMAAALVGWAYLRARSV